MRRARGCCLVVLSIVLAPSALSAQATLIDGLGGPAGYGTSEVPVGDDMSATVTVDITPAFPTGIDFFGTTYTQIHVNTNGNITFESRFGSFTPTAFPGAPQPLVAPWWGDGDTRGVVPDPPGANRIYYVVEPDRVIVTWYLLGYFGSHTDLLNSFQLVLTPPRDPRPDDPPNAFDLEIRYARCEWTTGDASGGAMGLGGVPAQAGYDVGDGVNFVTLPGSLTMDVLDLCEGSNVGEEGVWRLSPRGTSVRATCGNGFRETGEACDDGGVAPGDGCSATCRIETPPECGDGRRDPGEECDDDNTRDGDGCDARCFLELRACDPVPISRDASLLPDASCTDAGPRDAAIDGGRDVPLLEGGGCACRVRARSTSPRSALAAVIGALILLHRARRRREGQRATSSRAMSSTRS